MWRLSWIIFILFPLTFLAGIFGMSVSEFHDDPSLRWSFNSASKYSLRTNNQYRYFIAAVPLVRSGLHKSTIKILRYSDDFGHGILAVGTKMNAKRYRRFVALLSLVCSASLTLLCCENILRLSKQFSKIYTILQMNAVNQTLYNSYSIGQISEVYTFADQKNFPLIVQARNCLTAVHNFRLFARF